MTRNVLLLASGLALGITVPARAQAGSPLDALPTIGVHVIGVSSVATNAGIDSVDLRQRVERQLRRAGFEIAGVAELARRPETPRLVVNLGFFTTRDSSGVYSVLLELVELVQLKRNGLETHAVGWSEQALGISSIAQSVESTREATAALVDLFLSQSRRATLGGPAGGRGPQ